MATFRNNCEIFSCRFSIHASALLLKRSPNNMSILNSLNLYTFRYIVSDCDSVDVLFTDQHYTKSPEEAAAVTINAGIYIYIYIKSAHFIYNLDIFLHRSSAEMCASSPN